MKSETKKFFFAMGAELNEITRYNPEGVIVSN